MRIARWGFLTLIASVMVAVALLSAVEGADAQPIRIGVPVGLSGVNSVVAPAVVQSAELAVEEINARGGLLGRPVELVVVDDESGPSGAIRAFNTLIYQRNVDAIVTMETSAARNAGYPIAERARVLYLYTSWYEGGACGKYLFANGWVPPQVVVPLVEFMTVEKNAKRWFAVGSDYAFGRGMIEAAKQTIADMGGVVLGEEYLPLQATDWTAIISKIRAANPDAVIYSTSGGGPNIDFMKQYKAAGLTIPVASLSMDELTAQAGGDAAAGVYYAGDYFTAIDNPENERFLAEMRRKFGADLKTPNSLSQPQYDGIHLYAMAVEKAGTTDSDAVAAALPTVVFNGPRGPVQMNRQNHAALPIYLGQVQPDGSTRMIKYAGLIDPGDQCPNL